MSETIPAEDRNDWTYRRNKYIDSEGACVWCDGRLIYRLTEDIRLRDYMQQEELLKIEELKEKRHFYLNHTQYDQKMAEIPVERWEEHNKYFPNGWTQALQDKMMLNKYINNK